MYCIHCLKYSLYIQLFGDSSNSKPKLSALSDDSLSEGFPKRSFGLDDYFLRIRDESQPRLRICFDPEQEIPLLQKWFHVNNHPSRLQVSSVTCSVTVWQCDSFILPLCLYLCWGGAVHGGPQLGAREDWAAQVIFQYPVSVNCKKSLLILFPTQAGCPQHHLLVQKHPGGATEGGDQAAEGGRPHARALRGRDAQVGDQIVADCYEDQMQDGNWGSQSKGLWNQWQIQVFIIPGSSRGFR